MQKSYGAPGRLTDVGDIVSQHKKVKGAPALENILFGRIVGYVGSKIIGIQHPSPNKFILSADTVVSNVINLKLTVKTIDEENNEVITVIPIAPVTAGATHTTNMTAIKTAIQTADPKLTATVDTSDANSRTIYITHSDNAVVIVSDALISAGSSQATVSYGFYGTLLGPARKAPYEANKDGSVYHPPASMVGYMTQGTMTIRSVDAMTQNSTIYTQFIEDTNVPRGSIRTTAVSGKTLSFSSIKPENDNYDISAGSKANVEMNLP